MFVSYQLYRKRNFVLLFSFDINKSVMYFSLRKKLLSSKDGLMIYVKQRIRRFSKENEKLLKFLVPIFSEDGQ